MLEHIRTTLNIDDVLMKRARAIAEHGVDTILTDDRDFARFPEIATLSPATLPAGIR